MRKSIPVFVAMWILTAFMSQARAQDLPGKVVYSVSGMDKVEVRKNLVYRKDGPDEMKMDLYLPPNLTALDCLDAEKSFSDAQKAEARHQPESLMKSLQDPPAK